MLQAIDHLTALGHKKFGVISGPVGVGSAATTRDAFLAALAKRDLRAEHVIECNYRVDGGMSGSPVITQPKRFAYRIALRQRFDCNRRDQRAPGSKSPRAGRHIRGRS